VSNLIDNMFSCLKPARSHDYTIGTESQAMCSIPPYMLLSHLWVRNLPFNVDIMDRAI